MMSDLEQREIDEWAGKLNVEAEVREVDEESDAIGPWKKDLDEANKDFFETENFLAVIKEAEARVFDRMKAYYGDAFRFNGKIQNRDEATAILMSLEPGELAILESVLKDSKFKNRYSSERV